MSDTKSLYEVKSREFYYQIYNKEKSEGASFLAIEDNSDLCDFHVTVYSGESEYSSRFIINQDERSKLAAQLERLAYFIRGY